MIWIERVTPGHPPVRRRAAVSGRSLTTVAGLTLVALVTVFAPAVAQEADQQPEGDSASEDPDDGASSGSARLGVTELSGVLGPGSLPPPSEDTPVLPEAPEELRLRMLVENDGDVPLTALRVVVEVHEPVTTRGLLREALDGRLRSTAPLAVHVSEELEDGAALAPGAIAGVAEAFDRDEIGWAEGSGGVHPVRIAVTRGTEVLDEVVTAVVWLNSSPTSPLLTTMIWPLDTAPWRTTGGTYRDATGREIRPGGRLDALLAAAEGVRGAPLVLAPAAHLLEDLSDRSDGFETTVRLEDGSLETRAIAAEDADAQLARQTLRRIRELAAAQPHAPVSGTYADADLAALAEAGTDLLELAGVGAVEGRRRTQLQLGTVVDAAVHLVDGPISPAVLDLLPGDAVLLPSRATDVPAPGGDPPLDEPVRTVRTPSGRLLTALIADPYLEESFAADDHPAGPLVTAQRTIAETAIAYLVAPGSSDRGLVLLPPATWDPSPRAAAAVLEGLRDASWIRLSAPSRLASDARHSGSSIELVASEDGALRREFVTAFQEAATGLRSLEAALPELDSRIQGRSLQALQDDLLRATSRWYRGEGNGEADALVRDVQRTVDTTFGDIEISSGTVTLTSDTGQIPVTLQRSRGGPVNVVVSVESQGRLLWPEGRRSATLLLTEGGSQTVSFPTRALSTGTFPVTVRVMDPSGTTVVAATTLSVRSTAISGTALTATGLLVAILLLFGAFRRRDRVRPGLEVVDAP